MKIAITVGHSILKNGLCTSADGLINEYQYCKTLAPILVDILRKEGHEVGVIICPERQFTCKNQERIYKLPRINGKKYDLVIELHLNSYNGSAKGTEVLYYSNTGKMYAQRVVNKLGIVFDSRGVKDRPDLYMLNSTDCPAIMIETFFCDSKNDYDIATKLGYGEVAKLIAEGILNRSIENVSNNETKPQTYENAIIYSGDRDKAVAIIMKEFLPNSTIVDIADYKSYMCRNAYAIGDGASKGLEKYPDGVTRFVGKDFKETYRKVVEWLESRKFMQ
ncbi:N-acetylmuramoyl-L-alanine amidase [Metaclostridioides mangenotii]|uniref:N-acetylmuramoyl-L-alanine amidase n=1 Tax=Metaclostridioides mangenotii TaxID=1540 RepID=UPI000487F7CF|nr:N-acetylmuramoyl-L-alanine amidase [Clostridioides mangenotii]